MAANTLKSELRKKYLDQRSALFPKDALRKSSDVQKAVLELKQVREAKCIVCYVAVNNEVDTAAIINDFTRRKIPVFLPKLFLKKWVFSKFESWEKLKVGFGGISEPEDLILPSFDFDVCILPGVAFDKSGTRLGYGLGVFDRLLSHSKSLKIGLCYDFQLLDKLPRESHDLVVNFVVTEKRTISL